MFPSLCYRLLPFFLKEEVNKKLKYFFSVVGKQFQLEPTRELNQLSQTLTNSHKTSQKHSPKHLKQ